VAGAVLCRHNIGVLRGAAFRAVHTVRDHRSALDGQSRNGSAEHQSGGTPVPPSSGAHAGHRGRVLLHVLAAVSGADPVDHPGATRLQHHGNDRRQELLLTAILQPHYAVHQLGAQPYPVQPYVIQIPRRVPAAVWLAPRPVGQSAPGPQGHSDHDFRARGWLGHRWHYHHHRYVKRQKRRWRQRPEDVSGHGQHVRPDEAQRRYRHIGDREERPDFWRWRPTHHQAVEHHHGGHT